MQGFIVWLKRNELGHKERVAEYKHSVSYINSILEGVPQCFINMRILSFKFKSNKDAESGKIVEMAQTIFGKDCDMSVQLLGLKAIMTGITAVIGLFSFLTKGPVAIILSKKYKILLLVTIILGVGSKAMNTFYMIYNLDKFNCFVHNSTANLNGTNGTTCREYTPGLRAKGLVGDIFEDNLPNGFVKNTSIMTYLRLFGLNMFFVLWSLASLTRLGPRNYIRVITTFPQLAVVPLITPFTFGIMCKSCNCNHITDCKEKKIVFSKSLTAWNLFTTRILSYVAMIIDSEDQGFSEIPGFESANIVRILVLVAESVASIGILVLLLRNGRIS